MLKELSRCLILTSTVAIVGCSSVPKEDNSSVLMEDVIVERTTVRSTTQNPKPKPNGSGVYISGDNITVGTIIVNSPGAKVDNSTNTQISQQASIVSGGARADNGPSSSASIFAQSSDSANNTERDFANKIPTVLMQLAPSLIFGTYMK